MSHHEKQKLTHEAVQRWLDAYAHAWDTYDASDVEPLFTEDAEYRYHPADDPEAGRDEIVFGWLNPAGNASRRDKPGTYVMDVHPFAVDGNRAVAVGTCTYYTDASKSKVDRIYYNNWLLEFADDGRCRSFIEYYMTPRKG